MSKKLTLKKALIIVAALVMFMTVAFACVFGHSTVASAEENAPAEEVSTEDETGGASARLFTNLTLSLNGENGIMTAKVTNDFTLFPSTVEVYLFLYYSDEYCESYNQMTARVTAHTDDLNMGDSLRAVDSTGGVRAFWLARMRYRIGYGDWEELHTSVFYCDTDGSKLSEIVV